MTREVHITTDAEEYDLMCRFLIVLMKCDLLDDFLTTGQMGLTSLGEEIVCYEVWT